MDTKTVAKVAEVAGPSTQREASGNGHRKWESFPQPCGWALRWDNEGLVHADDRDTESWSISDRATPITKRA